MSEPTGGAPQAFVLRVSVPADGDLRIVASDVASKVAECLGEAPERTAAAGGAAEMLGARLADGGGAAEIAFEFHTAPDGMVIEARCGDRSATVRHVLTRMTFPADR
ncbi:MAG: hypothetical protein A3H96_01715 [Acidobacteria bacterium RIFCSPLOWO2_02_FULL_67_36]|nr:MAG: hypothetical protein A3H96_01715 [Acidobacteria bacterium RIFCSPLOWO2_02_FULL_67_36]OFW19920.1 MAG: hypothetical protein A3G21_09905 [Acidobacteria bacterium RIFCSPLOWO2_12_FULL_66_21]